MACVAAATALLLCSTEAARAQRDTTMHRPPGAPATAVPHDTMAMQMPMTGPLGISMQRMGSGTTWIPDAVTVPSRHFMAGGWMVMVHGFVFGQYDQQGGPRGASQFGSLNWGMLMADREFGGGRLQFRFMPSLDPATVGNCGYPLLLQSGETCNGQPLVDRQHPHDFFMELGALYERPISSRAAVLLYAAPAGEPALGPVAFMHRPSAMDEPQAPLGHHWQDATHISFGVVTAGIFTRKIRLEASAFNGVEPNEARWDFDPIRLNSWSARVTINPSANWSFTTGYGTLDNPEREAPPESVRRLVASAMYGRRLGTDGQLATTVIYGRNAHAGHEPSSSGLVESEAILDRANTLFGRAELVQKTAEDLQLSGFSEERLFNIGALSLGYIRELKRGRGVTFGIGARGTLNLLPSALEPSYGSRTPVGGMVFVRLRPYAQPAGGHQQMTGMPEAETPEMHHQPPVMMPDSPAVVVRSDSVPQHPAGHAAAPPVGDSAATTAMHDAKMMDLHMRMMSDPVIRARIMGDTTLHRMMMDMMTSMPAEHREMMERMMREMPAIPADTAAHRHEPARSPAKAAQPRPTRAPAKTKQATKPATKQATKQPAKQATKAPPKPTKQPDPHAGHKPPQ